MSYLGLGCEERLVIDQITVNGVGLRYGICYQYLKETYPDFNQRADHYKDLFQANRTRVGDLVEGTIVHGTVSNINPTVIGKILHWTDS